jgi:anti-sigma-K factor RskA
MSPFDDTQTCEPFSDDLAELALGILTGRDRAATLAHVESCSRCADELEHLARTADAIVSVAPETEPPVGFEVRLFNRMGLAPAPPARVAVLRSRATRWVLAAAAAVVALGVGLGLGMSAGSGPSPSVAAVASADLVEHGQTVGHVTIYGGARPWMFMNLADSTGRGTVMCKVVMADGQVVTVGTFMAHRGYGSWGAPLHVPPSGVRSAEVVSSSGAVIATAPLA